MFDVFIGFASESKKIGDAIKTAIDDTGVWRSRPWDRGDVFKPGRAYLESLFKALAEVDYAIFIATPLDKTVKRRRVSFAPRDNVLFEYGLFAGRNGRTNTAIMLVDKPDLPSDLHGITVHNIPGKMQSLRRKTKKQLLICISGK